MVVRLVVNSYDPETNWGTRTTSERETRTVGRPQDSFSTSSDVKFIFTTLTQSPLFEGVYMSSTHTHTCRTFYGRGTCTDHHWDSTEESR